MTDKQVRLLITGRVQGVWYRGWTVKTAKQLGLTGWVRNLATGQVEAVVLGDGISVETLISACHTGPELASVSSVEVIDDNSVLENTSGFRQIR